MSIWTDIFNYDYDKPRAFVGESWSQTYERDKYLGKEGLIGSAIEWGGDLKDLPSDIKTGIDNSLKKLGLGLGSGALLGLGGTLIAGYIVYKIMRKL